MEWVILGGVIMFVGSLAARILGAGVGEFSFKYHRAVPGPEGQERRCERCGYDVEYHPKGWWR